MTRRKPEPLPDVAGGTDVRTVAGSETGDIPLDDILGAVKQYWGYDSLRPLQEEAIRAGLERRDSLVVLPTGGGKSLCYQIPPLLTGGTDVVISPLISLMKDQVDGLVACGYPAAALHSNMAPDERKQTYDDIVAGRCRLIFVAPERLMTPGFQAMLSQIDVRAFAIDEAHCISHWGHDFRPEYRRLAELKSMFSGVSLHAYTATATERVRADIAEQLGLVDPALLVGGFDRPNLVYRVVPRTDVRRQIHEVVKRHADEAVIVYCISRKDTEAMSSFLQGKGIKADHYHAGLEREARHAVQEAFTGERLDVVVATVAFGMGIDRSNVRCVIHAAMPKSVEHYQQETGRAGRDGLEAECVLFYSGADVMKWTSILTRSAEEAGCGTDVIQPQLTMLEHLRAYCQPFQCRHGRLVEYFGQTYESDNCRACDVCLEECEELEDATVTAQKILSCVARTEQRFGPKHVADVLAGADTEMIRKWNHDQLSTHGLMADTPRQTLSHMVSQLIDQGLLDRSTDGFHTLRLNEASWQVMRGDRTVRMQRPPAKEKRKSRYGGGDGDARRGGPSDRDWIGVDRALFDSLRALRRELATDRGVPPFVIFSDASLRDMARRKPTTDDVFLTIHGVGEKKLADLGGPFMARIAEHATETNAPS